MRSGRASTLSDIELQSVADDIGISFDPFSEEFFRNPYPVYRRLLAEAPLYLNKARGFWALTRFEDVQACARDWETFSNSGGVDLGRGVQLLGAGGNFLDMDPPRHDLLRRVVREYFAPKSIAALEPAVSDHLDELIAELKEQDPVDLGTGLARRLPLRMISELLGFQRKDHDRLGALFLDVVQRSPGDAEIPPTARSAAKEMRAYIEEQSAERRRRSRSDLLSILVSAEAEGAISAEERLGICGLLFLAGTSTAAGLISTSLYLLADRPDMRRDLVENRNAIPQAVEELLRYISPVQALMRHTARDVELYETSIPEGATVLLVFGAANRDPRRFEDPDDLDLTRQIPRHLGFGEGIHFCLGAALARLEAKVVLATLLPQFPEYEVSGEVEWMRVPGDRGIEVLPVSLGRRGVVSRA